MFNYPDDPNPVTVTTGYTNTLSTIDDATLESFINLYANQILKVTDYVVIEENRENIRRLLNTMGEKNIADLKNNLSLMNYEEKTNYIKDYISKHFMPEDFILLNQYITVQ